MPHSKNSFAKRCWTPNRRRFIRVCVFWLCLFKSKISWAQKSLNWVQKVVWDWLGFALLYFVLVLTLDAATKFIMIWSFTISNALGNSMFCLVFYWRSVLNEAFISFCFNFYVSFFSQVNTWHLGERICLSIRSTLKSFPQFTVKLAPSDVFLKAYWLWLLWFGLKH